ncbi:hypothetical protein Nepgr_026940 [Nepenthes gracilis]|uniref:Uncharacterized protein n=1 Tax=Nepenthes gracilis TaxID=150966 RepID=A0AAD3TAS8_NEPGR|nr:hypothetical protein Nepgr_026940 [Nepenthes gracilis]
MVVRRFKSSVPCLKASPPLPLPFLLLIANLRSLAISAITKQFRKASVKKELAFISSKGWTHTSLLWKHLHLGLNSNKVTALYNWKHFIFRYAIVFTLQLCKLSC